MAEIKKREDQISALKAIQSELDMIGRINTIVGKGSYLILSANSADTPRTRSNSVLIDEKATGKVDTLLTSQRDRMIKEVRQKAEKFEIDLDESDESILSGNPPPSKGKARK